MRCNFPSFCRGRDVDGISAWSQAAGAQQLPADIAAPGEKEIITLHAQGAQIYECAATKDGKFAWSFREPIATLLLKGKTVGRHYAGPNWEYMDGSAVVAKVAGRAPGKTPKDIPWLKLDRDLASRQGHVLGRHHHPAHQHRRRPARRPVQHGRHLQQRALRDRLCVPEEIGPFAPPSPRCCLP